ncbi:FIST N-terminal domain-containing protein [Granulosicoccus antarcticus]|uniref:FIST N domain protein n=1 Tax=Granulosicoccus antarcticus IMCC3135 TaxID=1192854 RepID=A0A2Z2NW12_9GAMM|nr:FIST N-terminal domain-containing protein [Granulosicoccus antarcticus]ASJ74241.1 hypothetical protein IMCC3135_20820 [Granulosicoccus antarcticus IMCC3135]
MQSSTAGPISQKRYSSGIQALWSKTATTDQVCSSIAGVNAEQDFSACIIWFSASCHHPEALVSGMAQHSPALKFCGCSTSGEITPDGLQDDGIVAILLPARWFCVHTFVMQNIANLGMENIAQYTSDQRESFLDSLPQTDPAQTQFALLLIDGLTYSEETVTVAIDRGLAGIPLIGGSAGDNLEFIKTWQISNGHACTGAAMLSLISCKLPCQVYTNNNFVPTEHKLVVTESDPNQRRISEFNAEPAAVAYANAIGMRPDELDAGSFASYSVIIRMGDKHYCRSIQQLNDDLSLTFFCAIDNGLVLTLARSEGMVSSSRQAIEELEHKIGPIDVMFGFDCIYRKLDAQYRQTSHRIAELYKEKNFIGFNSYGEQYNSMHINHTFTGIAIGMPPE